MLQFWFISFLDFPAENDYENNNDDDNDNDNNNYCYCCYYYYFWIVAGLWYHITHTANTSIKDAKVSQAKIGAKRLSIPYIANGPGCRVPRLLLTARQRSSSLVKVPWLHPWNFRGTGTVYHEVDCLTNWSTECLGKSMDKNRFDVIKL